MNKQDFFNTSLKIEDVTVPDFGKVFVKTMTCFERDEYEILVLAADGKAGARARMVICTVCDAQGKNTFDDGDLEKVKNIGSHIIQPLWNKAVELNHFDSEDVAKIEKN